LQFVHVKRKILGVKTTFVLGLQQWCIYFGFVITEFYSTRLWLKFILFIHVIDGFHPCNLHMLHLKFGEEKLLLFFVCCIL